MMMGPPAFEFEARMSATGRLRRGARAPRVNPRVVEAASIPCVTKMDDGNPTRQPVTFTGRGRWSASFFSVWPCCPSLEDLHLDLSWSVGVSGLPVQSITRGEVALITLHSDR